MARGFGATSGVDASDRVTSALTSLSADRSWFAWFLANSAGSSGLGRVFDKFAASPLTELLTFNGDSSQMNFTRGFSTSNGAWVFTAPSLSAWHPVLVTYNSTAAANNPIIYLDGSSVSLTPTAPTGTATTNSDAYTLGNRAIDSARGWDGLLAEFAVWDRILTASEAAQLAKGFSPLFFPLSLVEYLPLVTPLTSWKRAAATAAGTAIKTHPRIFRPVGPLYTGIPQAISTIAVAVADTVTLSDAVTPLLIVSSGRRPFLTTLGVG